MHARSRPARSRRRPRSPTRCSAGLPATAAADAGARAPSARARRDPAPACAPVRTCSAHHIGARQPRAVRMRSADAPPIRYTDAPDAGATPMRTQALGWPHSQSGGGRGRRRWHRQRRPRRDDRAGRATLLRGRRRARPRGDGACWKPGGLDRLHGQATLVAPDDVRALLHAAVRRLPRHARRGALDDRGGGTLRRPLAPERDLRRPRPLPGVRADRRTRARSRRSTSCRCRTGWSSATTPTSTAPTSRASSACCRREARAQERSLTALVNAAHAAGAAARGGAAGADRRRRLARARRAAAQGDERLPAARTTAASPSSTPASNR